MWRKIEPKKYICGEKMTNIRPTFFLVKFWTKIDEWDAEEEYPWIQIGSSESA